MNERTRECMYSRAYEALLFHGSCLYISPSLPASCLLDVGITVVLILGTCESFGEPSPTRILLHEYRGLRVFTFFWKLVFS